MTVPGTQVIVLGNYGFHNAMRESGIEVVTTPVGDRNVSTELEQRGWVLGGEQSGRYSAAGQKRREYWARRNRARSKAKHHDRLFRSLVEVLGAFLPRLPVGELCSCAFGGDDMCELCSALDAVGLPPFDTLDRVLSDLAKLSDRIAAETAAPAA